MKSKKREHIIFAYLRYRYRHKRKFPENKVYNYNEYILNILSFARFVNNDKFINRIKKYTNNNY